MTKLTAVLKQKLENARKVAILGVGSELRSDDAAGVLAAQQIKKISRQKNKSALQVKVFIGETAPENLTGEIKKFKPSHLMIIDSADMSTKPGRIKIINPDKVGGTSFCTHSLPIKVMIDYLQQSCPDLKVIVIGIQPQSIVVGSNVSKEISQAVEELTATIINLFQQKTCRTTV